jgi:hypothetical protein
MSSAVSIIKEAGPYVVALAGMAAGYFGGRQSSREARHHGRVEILYRDMLTDLQHRHWRLMQSAGPPLGEGPEPELEKLPGPVGVTTVNLLASKDVSTAWLKVHHTLYSLGRLVSDGVVSDQSAFYIGLSDYDVAVVKMTDLMRADLGIPGRYLSPPRMGPLRKLQRRRIRREFVGTIRPD